MAGDVFPLSLADALTHGTSTAQVGNPTVGSSITHSKGNVFLKHLASSEVPIVPPQQSVLTALTQTDDRSSWSNIREALNVPPGSLIDLFNNNDVDTVVAALIALLTELNNPMVLLTDMDETMARVNDRTQWSNDSITLRDAVANAPLFTPAHLAGRQNWPTEQPKMPTRGPWKLPGGQIERRWSPERRGPGNMEKWGARSMPF